MKTGPSVSSKPPGFYLIYTLIRPTRGSEVRIGIINIIHVNDDKGFYENRQQQLYL